MVFDLPVTGEKVKPQQVTALHLFCSLAFIGTGAIIFIYNYQITYWGLALLIAGCVLLALTIFRNKWIINRKVNLAIRVMELFVAASVGLLSYTEQWKFPMVIFGGLIAAILFSLYWERSAGQKMYVHIDETGVRLPVTSRKRFIAWPEVDQVLLRYGVLSIDCIDNKLYQFDVSGTTSDKDEFETFCTAQVLINKRKPVENDW